MFPVRFRSAIPRRRQSLDVRQDASAGRENLVCHAADRRAEELLPASWMDIGIRVAVLATGQCSF